MALSVTSNACTHASQSIVNLLGCRAKVRDETGLIFCYSKNINASTFPCVDNCSLGLNKNHICSRLVGRLDPKLHQPTYEPYHAIVCDCCQAEPEAIRQIGVQLSRLESHFRCHLAGTSQALTKRFSQCWIEANDGFGVNRTVLGRAEGDDTHASPPSQVRWRAIRCDD